MFNSRKSTHEKPSCASMPRRYMVRTDRSWPMKSWKRFAMCRADQEVDDSAPIPVRESTTLRPERSAGAHTFERGRPRAADEKVARTARLPSRGCTCTCECEGCLESP